MDVPLKSADLLAVNALGQFAEHPRVAALREFITGWYVSYLSADSGRGQPEAGPQERLTKTGDNVANVIQYLAEQHGDRLERIFDVLRAARAAHRKRVGRDHAGRPVVAADQGRAFQPTGSRALCFRRHAEDAGLPGAAQRPGPPPFIGIEEPENYLHPRLLPELAEECRVATERTQLLVTTHSPFFLNALRPEEVRVLWRDEQGYTQTRRASDLPGGARLRRTRRIARPSLDGGATRRRRSVGQPGLTDPAPWGRRP